MWAGGLWTVPPSGLGPVTEIWGRADNGITDNQKVYGINQALAAVAAAGGGNAQLRDTITGEPYSTSGLGIGSKLIVPTGVYLKGPGTGIRKNPPATGVPAAGGLNGLSIMPAGDFVFAYGDGIVVLEDQAAISDLSILGYGGPETASIAPNCTALVSAGLQAWAFNLMLWSSPLATLDITGADFRGYNIVAVNNIPAQGVSVTGNLVAGGPTFTPSGLPAGFTPLAGMNVTSTDGSLPQGTFIAAINAGVWTLQNRYGDAFVTSNASITLVVNPLWFTIPNCTTTNNSTVIGIPAGYTTALGAATSWDNWSVDAGGGAGNLPALPGGTTVAAGGVNNGASTVTITANAQKSKAANITIEFHAGDNIRLSASDAKLTHIDTLAGCNVWGGADFEVVAGHFSGSGKTNRPTNIVRTAQGGKFTGGESDGATPFLCQLWRQGGHMLLNGHRFMNGQTGHAIVTSSVAIVDDSADNGPLQIANAQVPYVGADGYLAFLRWTGNGSPASAVLNHPTAETNSSGVTPFQAGAGTSYSGWFLGGNPAVVTKPTIAGAISGADLPAATAIKQSALAVAVGVSGVDGAATNIAANAGSNGFTVPLFSITTAGVVAGEQITVTLKTTNSDGTNNTVSVGNGRIATGFNGKFDFLAEDLIGLIKNGVYITALAVTAHSGNATTAATVTASLAGQNL